MKRIALLISLMLPTLLIAGPSLAQNQGKKCIDDCGWYYRNFQEVRDDLEKSYNSLSKVTHHDLGRIFVEMEIDLGCAKKACADKKHTEELDRIRSNYGRIIGIIRSGRLKTEK